RDGYPAAENVVGGMQERGLLSANSRPEMVDALRWYKYAQAKRNPRALVKMAEGTEQEKAGVSRSSEVATNLYLQAADLGHPPALVIAGNKYVAGRGVKRDYAEALKLYTAAAELNYPEAEFKVGEMYERGRGVKRNTASAKAWYRRASNRGHVTAQAKLKRLGG
ncbi:MAG TPA: tetratricopeptide repeat protein, partial [Arenicellales bacterium]|nr:tetratricopeptide repeat protein [Arenicellales bacterium]